MEPGTPSLMGRTSFFGRDEELSRLAVFLKRGERLLTIVGPGGVGKTRVAHELYNRFIAPTATPYVPVSLDSLNDPALVLPTIASALGLREVDRRSDLIPRIAEQFRDQPAFLLLDSLEHLLDAAPEIRYLHDACPGLTVLVTSRSPMQVAREQVVLLDPFDIPEDPDDSAIALLWANPAVRLLADRAKSAGGDVGTGDTRTLARIVRRVEGIPLAIELAAARIWKFRSADALLLSLDSPLSALDQGYRDGSARHQTMRAAIDWSYRLLSAEEQALFARLAVCAGGFDLELASRLSRGRLAGGPYPRNEGYGPAVFGSHPFESDPFLIPAEEPDYSLAVGLPALDGDPASLLASLVRNNLIRHTEGSDGTPRYVMLDVLREYGLEVLEARGELAGARHAHAIAMMALAEMSAPLMFSKIAGPWTVARIRDNHGNFRAAISWADSHKAAGAELVSRIVDPIWQHFQHRGMLGEVRRWFERALWFPTVPPVSRGFALGWLALTCWIQGDDIAAKQAVDEGIRLAQRLEFSILEARALVPAAAAIAWRAGDLGEMASCIERARPIYQQWQDPVGAGICLFLQGQLLRMMHKPADARRALDEAYALTSMVGYTWGMATTRYHAAEAMHDLGDQDASIALLAEALALYWEDEDGWGGGSVTSSIAVIASEREEFELAARFFGIAATLLARAGAFLPPTQMVHYAAVERRVRGELQEAFSPAFEAGRALSPSSGIAEVRAYLAGTSPAKPTLPPVPRPHPDLPELTPRQREIVALLLQSKPPKVIAKELGVEPVTVYDHIKKACASWGVSSRDELVLLAVRSGQF